MNGSRADKIDGNGAAVSAKSLETSINGTKVNGSPPVFKLPQVHSSSRPSNVSSIQSLLKRAPKLYKYSQDQVEVIILRRTGELENISVAGRTIANIEDQSSRPQLQPPETSRKLESSNSAKIQDPSSKDAVICNGVSTHAIDEIPSAVLNNPYSSPCEAINHYPFHAIAIDEATVSNHVISATNVTTKVNLTGSEIEITQCEICAELQLQVKKLELALSKLKQSVSVKDVQLQKSKRRISEIMMQNAKLNSNASGLQSKLYQLADIVKLSNEVSDANDRRIAEIFESSRAQRKPRPTS